ncbi:MAG TPA: AtpZ/AtpI family protein [Blastocatellia bacterium]|jgi:F0F1-type ATP synthase assembly protein I|nr:AtpZ/AtpI family protein [Blastocatellia bacterium]
MASDDDNQSGGISWRQALTTVGLALAIPSTIGVPVVVGWWLDKRFGTSFLLIVGLILGLLGAAFDIYTLLKRFGQFK